MSHTSWHSKIDTNYCTFQLYPLKYHFHFVLYIDPRRTAGLNIHCIRESNEFPLNLLEPRTSDEQITINLPLARCPPPPEPPIESLASW